MFHTKRARPGDHLCPDSHRHMALIPEYDTCDGLGLAELVRNEPVKRSFLPPLDQAFVVARGEGRRVFDAAGRRYIDDVLASGPMILGHGHPAVVEAITEQATRGTSFYGLNAPAIELAEEINLAAKGDMSLAHTDEDLADTLTIFDESLAAVTR